MEKSSIAVKDLCKQFDDFRLDHVSFQVPGGRIVGFIGENGAGKTTTINLILNELKKDSGQVLLFGQDHACTALREKIGVVFDECNFHDVFTTSDIEKIADYVIFIHQGKIVFEELKDTLIYHYGILKCGREKFTSVSPDDYIISRDTGHGMECLVRDRESIRRRYKDVILDRASLEDIMLFYINSNKYGTGGLQ